MSTLALALPAAGRGVKTVLFDLTDQRHDAGWLPTQVFVFILFLSTDRKLINSLGMRILSSKEEV